MGVPRAGAPARPVGSMSSSEWQYAGADEDVPDGELREVHLDGTPVLLARVGGCWLACSGDCTHDLCPLVEGELRGPEIHCSCHGSAFDVRTGEVLLPPANEPLPVYRLRSEAGRLLVALDHEKEEI